MFCVFRLEAVFPLSYEVHTEFIPQSGGLGLPGLVSSQCVKKIYICLEWEFSKPEFLWNEKECLTKMNIWNRLYLQGCLMYVMKDDTSLNLKPFFFTSIIFEGGCTTMQSCLGHPFGQQWPWTWQMPKYGVQFNMTMPLSGLFSFTFLSFVVTPDILWTPISFNHSWIVWHFHVCKTGAAQLWGLLQ